MAHDFKIGFGAVGIKNGTEGSLDYINSDSFTNRDICIVNSDNTLYFYYVDQYSGETESFPYIIQPIDIKPTSPIAGRLKRWKLFSQKTVTTNIILPYGKYLQTSLIKALENEILEIDQNGEMLIVYENGNVEFTKSGGVTDVTENNHLTSKEYLEYMLDNLENLITIFSAEYFNDDQYLINNLNTMRDNLELYVSNALDGNIYVSTNVDNLDTEITTYTDTKIGELNTTIQNTYNKEELEFSTWFENSGLYYSDETHNLDTREIIDGYYIGNEKIDPEKVEFIGNNIIRLWMPVDTQTVNGKLFYIGEYVPPPQ